MFSLPEGVCWKACRSPWLSSIEGDRAGTAISKLEFWWQAQLEGDRATTVIRPSAMSHLLIQMAQEMNRRASEQGAGDPSQSNGQGGASGSRKEMKIDEVDSFDAYSILEELDIKKRIIRIQELVGRVFRLAMPDSWCLWARTERSHQLSRSDSIV